MRYDQDVQLQQNFQIKTKRKTPSTKIKDEGLKLKQALFLNIYHICQSHDSRKKPLRDNVHTSQFVNLTSG